MKLVEFAGLSNRPNPGSKTELYLDTDTGVIFRWTGAAFATMGSNSGTSLPLRAGRKAVLLGHSYAEKHWTVSASESTFNPSGAFIHANAELHWPWDIVANGGVTGETSDQILARVDALLSTYSPDWVLIPGCFINDIYADRSAETIIGYAEQILAKLSGLNVVWCTEAASQRNAGTASRKAVLHACNRWLKEQQASVPGLIVPDTYSATVDTATGYGVAAMYAETTTSQLHYNTLGAASAGRAIVRTVNRAGGMLPSPVFATGVDDYKNLVFNPYAVGDNASGAGGYTQGTGITLNYGPNGWISEPAFSGTAALSKEASATATEVQGNFAKMAITAGAAQSGAGWQWWLTASSTRANNTPYALGAHALRMATTTIVASLRELLPPPAGLIQTFRPR